MSWKRGLGIGLIFAGILIIASAGILTGAVVGVKPENYLGIFGVLVLIIGMVLVLAVTLEKRLRPGESEIGDVDLKDSDLIYQRPDVLKRRKKKQVSRAHYEAHNAVRYKQLRDRYKFIESHGVPPEDSKAWVTLYHGLTEDNADFSQGLDKNKVPDLRGQGFYLATDKNEAREYVVGTRGGEPEDVKIVEVKIAKGIYNPKDKKGIVIDAHNPDKPYVFIPRKKFDKANELIKKGLIRITEPA